MAFFLSDRENVAFHYMYLYFLSSLCFSTLINDLPYHFYRKWFFHVQVIVEDACLIYIVGKGENFLLFSQCFLPYVRKKKGFFFFCRLQIL